MSYLIDGHNLIPWVRGLSLQRLDDEMELVQRLQVFCRVRRQTVEVFFDRAAPGRAGSRNFGMVRAVFVPQSSTADEVIRDRLKKLGTKAKHWKVVSSDRQVQAEVRASHAEVIPSDQFAAILESTLLQAAKNPSERQGLSADEVDEWLKMFEDHPPEGKGE